MEQTQIPYRPKKEKSNKNDGLLPMAAGAGLGVWGGYQLRKGVEAYQRRQYFKDPGKNLRKLDKDLKKIRAKSPEGKQKAKMKLTRGGNLWGIPTPKGNLKGLRSQYMGGPTPKVFSRGNMVFMGVMALTGMASTAIQKYVLPPPKNNIKLKGKRIFPNYKPTHKGMGGLREFDEKRMRRK